MDNEKVPSLCRNKSAVSLCNLSKCTHLFYLQMQNEFLGTPAHSEERILKCLASIHTVPIGLSATPLPLKKRTELLISEGLFHCIPKCIFELLKLHDRCLKLSKSESRYIKHTNIREVGWIPHNSGFSDCSDFLKILLLNSDCIPSTALIPTSNLETLHGFYIP